MRDEIFSNKIKTVLFDKEERYVEDFLRLPVLLYSKQNITQKPEEERSLLMSEHPFSKYFELHKMLVYEDGQPAARGILTLYPGDKTGYFGFFEAKEGSSADYLFKLLDKVCREQGVYKIVGPVNCSFWIGYRQKTNKFDMTPYISEPYNLPYYKELWLKNGFETRGSWLSNYYDIVERRYHNQKYADSLDKFLDKGYEIVSPKRKDFEKCLNEVYDLIMELYSDFPVFKEVAREDFSKYFAGFRAILDFSMVKMAYYNGRTVGFFMGVPDYSNSLYGKITLPALARLLMKRVRSTSYVMLYMGVKREHRGLGRAMTQAILENVKKKKAHCYGALIQEGKVTKNYVKDKIMESYEYLLYEKVLNNGGW